MNDGLIESAQSLLSRSESTLDQAAANILNGDGLLVPSMVDLLTADDLMALGGRLVGVQRQTSGRILDMIS